MRRLLRLSCLIALIFVLFSACAEATDWLNQYEEEEIDVLYLDAEYLKNFVGKYEGRAVCTKLYFDKTGDEDGQILTIGRENGEFDIKVNFEDASEYRYLESNDSFVVVGIVGTKDAVLVNSHIVPSEQVEGIQFFNSEQYVMRLGDKNDDVYQLQEKLIEKGLYSGKATGEFDAETEAAVKAYQEACGLPVTGECSQNDFTNMMTSENAEAQEAAEADYVYNKNTHKFHETWCSSVEQMKEKNKGYFTGSRDELLEMGYDPCKNCKP